MKKSLGVFAALALAACVTVPAEVHVNSGKALIAAESTLDAAILATTTALSAHLTTPAQNRMIASLTAPCPIGIPLTMAVATASCPVIGGLTLARDAYAASDTASFPVLTANLLSLASRLATTHP